MLHEGESDCDRSCFGHPRRLRQRARPTGAGFYKDKQIRMIVGHEVGNDYDLGGPLPRAIPRQAPPRPADHRRAEHAGGGGSPRPISSTRRRRATARVIGSISRNLPSQALMGQANIEADPRRFNWLGATSLPGRVCVRLAHRAGQDRRRTCSRQELIVGGVGAGSSTSIVPTVFNHVLGTKFHMIEGYEGAHRHRPRDGARRGAGRLHVLRPVPHPRAALPGRQAALPPARRGSADARTSRTCRRSSTSPRPTSSAS